VWTELKSFCKISYNRKKITNVRPKSKGSFNSLIFCISRGLEISENTRITDDRSGAKKKVRDSA